MDNVEHQVARSKLFSHARLAPPIILSSQVGTLTHSQSCIAARLGPIQLWAAAVITRMLSTAQYKALMHSLWQPLAAAKADLRPQVWLSNQVCQTVSPQTRLTDSGRISAWAAWVEAPCLHHILCVPVGF